MSEPTSATNKSENPARRRRFEAGFTLLEVMVTVGILVLVASAVIVALLQMNTNAMAARLKTLASVAALNQIELVSTDAPFSPADDQIPVELTLGNQTAPILIYDDPNSDTTVSGTITTTVDDPGYFQNGFNLFVRRVTVTVSYEFRNRTYVVKMHTIRASDV